MAGYPRAADHRSKRRDGQTNRGEEIAAVLNPEGSIPCAHVPVSATNHELLASSRNQNRKIESEYQKQATYKKYPSNWRNLTSDFECHT
jgi:hypothetical protein